MERRGRLGAEIRWPRDAGTYVSDFISQARPGFADSAAAHRAASERARAARARPRREEAGVVVVVEEVKAKGTVSRFTEGLQGGGRTVRSRTKERGAEARGPATAARGSTGRCGATHGTKQERQWG